MKKISLILLLLVLTVTTVFAASLPSDVLSVKVVGDYRKMTTEYNSTEYIDDVNTLLGVGFGFEYDTYFNSFVGVFTTVNVVIPVKSDINGTSQEFDDRDFPVSAEIGFAGRVPFTSMAGLDLRLGFGVVYDKSTPYGYTIVKDGKSTYIVTPASLSKVETQFIGGLGVYGYFDPYGNFGLKAGVDLAYTFYTGLYLDSTRSGSSYNVDNLKRSGYEVMPYVAFAFGF